MMALGPGGWPCAEREVGKLEMFQRWVWCTLMWESEAEELKDDAPAPGQPGR